MLILREKHLQVGLAIPGRKNPALFVKYRSLKKNGAIIVGYGAPAKGNTFLNFSKIRMDFIVDDNKLKQGMFTPGSSIPIVSSDDIKNLNPDVFVVFVPLAWNFFKEIKQRIKAIRNNPNDVFLNLNDI